MPDWLDVPDSLRALTLSSPAVTDNVACEILARCPALLEELSLQGTRVTESIFRAVERFPRLRYLDVASTAISADELQRFVARHPSIERFSPRRAPPRA